MDKIQKIFLNSVPVLIMVGMIPLIQNDYLLALTFVLVISICFWIKRESNEPTVFVLGFFIMTFFEYIFVLTGVEVFYRNSLLGLMPIWLPFLWAYGFVAISRAVKILNK